MESNCCGVPTQSGRMAALRKDFGVKSIFNRVMLFASAVALPLTFKGTDADASPRTEFATNFDDAAVYADGGIDDPAPKKTTDGDEIKISGHDMRGSGADIKKIEDGAGAMSMQGDMVILAYLDPRGKDDAIIKAQNDLFLKEIKEAIVENIKAGRKDIKLILADKTPGSTTRLYGIAKGHLGNQVNYNDTKALGVYIKRGYEKYGYKTHPVANASTSATTPATYNVNDIAVATNE